MAFITQVPSAADLARFGAGKLLRSPYQLWTVDPQSDTFLILKRESNDPQTGAPYEDFFFHYRTRTVLVSVVQHLHTEGNDVVFVWTVLGSLDVPQLQQVDAQGLLTQQTVSAADLADYLDNFEQAFRAYKRHSSAAAADKLRVDTQAVLGSRP